MSESIASGQSVDLPVRAGDSLKLGYLGGTYSAVAIAGLSGLPSALATNATTSQTLGPWARNIVVRLSTSANGRVEYAVGNPPVFAPAGIQHVRTSDGVPVELKGLGANAEYLAAGSSPTAPASLAASGSYSTSLTEGTRYESAAPTVSGGVPPYAFGSAGGALPPGMRVNPTTGVLHGVPSVQGNYPGTKIRATDQAGSFIDITVGAIVVSGAAVGLTSGIVVANRLQVPTVPSGGNVNPLRTYQREHTAHADGAISNLRLTNLWWVLSATTFLPAAISGSPAFTWRQWVEYPQGTFTPVLFGGSPDCVLNTTTKLRTSDSVNVSIPAGAKFWVHTVNAGSTSLMPVTETPANASVIGTTDAFYDMADLSTPVHQATGSATVNYIGPSLITGDVAAANAKAVLLVGDSLVYAQGDVTNVGTRGSSGAYARKLDALGASYVKYAQKGATAQAYASGVANVNYTDFMALVRAAVTHVVIQPGINDVRLARTQAQVLADRAILVADFAGKSVVETTLTPRTSSTDSWATVANQTQQTDGNMAEWANVNTAIRGVAGSALMEVANVVANAPGGLLWACPPGATPPVLDGTHMTSPMAAYAAENISYTL